MSYVPPPKYDAETLAQMRRLWERAPELSATKIGAQFGVSKNTIIGQANRRGWRTRRIFREPITTIQRIDAINFRMDAVLAETRPFVEGRPKVLVAAEAREPAA